MTVVASCAHFQQVGPGSYITHTTTVGPWNCPWCEIDRLRQYEPLKGGVPVREWALQQNLKLAEEGLANSAQENAELRRCLDGGVDCAEEKLRLREALKKIAAYDPGQFRPLEDEIAIWRLATEALAGCLREPQSGPTNEKA